MLKKNAEMMTPSEAAKALGITMHRVYNEIWNRNLPAFRIGKMWRVPKAAIQERLQRMAEDLGSSRNNAGDR